MIIHYIKNTFKYFRKYKTYTIINLLGLVVGLTASILILLDIGFELSYDNFHKMGSRIYRVNYTLINEGKEKTACQTTPNMSAVLKNRFPQIINSVRLSLPHEMVLSVGQDKITEKSIFFADSTLLQIFDFPLVNGDSITALNRPNSIIITQEMAHKYFGNANPLGKIIKADNRVNLEITGILKDIPSNSHLQFDFVISMSTSVSFFGDNYLSNNSHMFQTYLLLKDNLAKDAIDSQLSVLEKELFQNNDYHINFYLQQLSDIHFQTIDYDRSKERRGDIRMIYFFVIIAGLILLIACFNFINITTALYNKRLKEIAVRKVFGSKRGGIALLFIIESFIILTIGFLTSVVIANLTFPLLCKLTGNDVVFSSRLLILLLLILFPLVLSVSIYYPVFFVSRNNPLRILKNDIIRSAKSGSFRKILVVFQFFVTILLIIASLVVVMQLNYMRNCDLGFDKSALVVIPLKDNNADKLKIIKSQLLQNSEITSICASFGLPGVDSYALTGYKYEGMPAENEYSKSMIWNIQSDEDFIKTFGVKVLDGRDFSPRDTIAGQQGYLLNEAAVKFLNWEKPIGKRFSTFSPNGVVIGVIKDFTFGPLRSKVEPMCLTLIKWPISSHITMKLNTKDIHKTLDFIDESWQNVYEGVKPEMIFYDEYFERIYKSDIQLRNVILTFSLIAIIIAVLGLFGLIMLSIEQRTKEIGIRKINGASLLEIVKLQFSEYTKLLIISALFACPIGYYLMNLWLSQFAFRIEMGVSVFVISALVAYTIAILTISWQVWRSANKNPIEALRYE